MIPRRYFLSVVGSIWIVACILAIGQALAATPASSNAVSDAGQMAARPEWDAKTQGAFVMSLCAGFDGQIWVGTEDDGVWRWDPKAQAGKQWTQFTTKNGLGDDSVYALACDREGRIWAGQLSHGVSVFCAGHWRNYDVLDGPIGAHIFAIATCPTDGDVWMATSGGLSRYSLAEDTWTSYTRADGLPSNQPDAVAFNAAGDIFVGAQCDGIAMARAADGYKTWSAAVGPEEPPAAAEGAGLPSSLINCLMVNEKTGEVYAGTTAGLATSTDGGKTWRYLRGANWEARARGELHPPGLWAAQAGLHLLPNDYVSALGEDSSGRVWAGCRQGGYATSDPARRTWTPEGGDDYVTAILPLPDGRVLLGHYGSGIRVVAAPAGSIAEPQPALGATPAAGEPQLPGDAIPWSNAELAALAARVAALPKGGLRGAYLRDDWKTEGDWIGQFGRSCAVLCGAGSPLDHVVLSDMRCSVHGQIGPHHAPGDSLRHWVQWATTTDQRVLYDPMVGCRREAEWDDHGETYSQDYEGPDLWLTVRAPAGVYRISLYFFNKDGHTASNRYRDYLIELWPPAKNSGGSEATPIARARVTNFWGGCYKEFAVMGPGAWRLRVAKNGSLNIVLPAVMVDKLADSPGDKQEPAPMPWVGGNGFAPPPLPVEGGVQAPGPPDPADVAIEDAARSVWDSLDGACDSAGAYALQWAGRVAAYRAMCSVDDPAGLVTADEWRWKLALWTPADRDEWDDAMAAAWQARRRGGQAAGAPVAGK